jgi:hypothetical protein
VGGGGGAERSVQNVRSGHAFKCMGRPKSSKIGVRGLTEHKDLLKKNYFNIFSYDTHHILWENLSTKVSI